MKYCNPVPSLEGLVQLGGRRVIPFSDLTGETRSEYLFDLHRSDLLEQLKDAVEGYVVLAEEDTQWGKDIRGTITVVQDMDALMASILNQIDYEAEKAFNRGVARASST